jgi:hypothetical protein
MSVIYWHCASLLPHISVAEVIILLVHSLLIPWWQHSYDVWCCKSCAAAEATNKKWTEHDHKYFRSFLVCLFVAASQLCFCNKGYAENGVPFSVRSTIYVKMQIAIKLCFCLSLHIIGLWNYCSLLRSVPLERGFSLSITTCQSLNCSLPLTFADQCVVLCVSYCPYVCYIPRPSYH